MKMANDNSNIQIDSFNKRQSEIISLKVHSISTRDQEYLTKIIAWLFLVENLKIKLRKGLQNQMKRIDQFLLLFYFIGFVTNLIQDQLYFHFEQVKTETTVSVIVKGIPTLGIQVIRIFTSITTVICLILLPFHYKLEKYLQVMKNETSMATSFFSPRILLPRLLLFIMTIIHAPPYFDGFYVTISTTDTVKKHVKVDMLMFINVLVTLRWLFGVYYFSLYSVFADDRADKICEESKVKREFFFAVKSQLKYQPFLTIIILFVSSVFLLGYMLRNTEAPFIQEIPLEKYQDWSQVLNAFWCIMLSFFTIGYGDYYPQTMFGRIVVSFSCLWGIFLVGLFIIHISSKFLLNNIERKIYDETIRDWAMTTRKKKALELIYYCYCFNNIGKNTENLTEDQEKRQNKLLLQIRELLRENNNLRRENTEEQVQSKTTHLLDHFNTKIENDIDDLLNRTRSEIESTKSKIKSSKNTQLKTKRYLHTLSKMTKCLYDTIDNKTDMTDLSISNNN